MSTDSIKEALGKNLREARLDKRMTQEGVADAIGSTVNYYAKIERGKSIPSLQMLEKLCEVLDKTATELAEF